MKDPERFLDRAGDDFERLLLRSANGDVGSAAAKARCIAAASAIGVVVTPTAAAASAAKTSAVATASAPVVSGLAAYAVKSAGVGLVLGALASGAGMALSTPTAPAPVREAARWAPAQSRGDNAPLGERASASEPLPAPSSATLESLEDTRAPRAALGNAAMAAPPRDTPSRRLEPASARRLEREVELLDGARQALARGDASRASEEVSRYEAEFPRGMLGPEAIVLRVEVLLRQGRRTAAEALARRFLAANPSGAYARRLEELLKAPPLTNP
jgi:hypothetical protein